MQCRKHLGFIQLAMQHISDSNWCKLAICNDLTYSPYYAEQIALFMSMSKDFVFRLFFGSFESICLSVI